MKETFCRHIPSPASLPYKQLLTLALLMLLFISLNGAGGAKAQGTTDIRTSATRSIYLPSIMHKGDSPNCATGTDYNPIFIEVGDRRSSPYPVAQDDDINLALRGYQRVVGDLDLVDYNGGTDSGAPQLSDLFTGRRAPVFSNVYQVNQADSDPQPGQPISWPPVTLAGLRTMRSEQVHVPSRQGGEIYGGGYVSMVIYAEETRLTLKYTREDSIVEGYTIHLENICVDPDLLALYRQLDVAGRTHLPGLHARQVVGVALGSELRVAIRDRGTFMDPRSRKDWWVGY